MQRLVLATACLVIVTGSGLALDRSPDPVPIEILDNPKPEHVPTLIRALNGSGCRPKHTRAGDALVQIGKPSVEPLVRRLKSSSTWSAQLECVYLLALIGPDAADAAEDLEEWLESKRHPLPRKYGEVALVAARGDVDGLIEIMLKGETGATPLAGEILSRDRTLTPTETQIQRLRKLTSPPRRLATRQAARSVLRSLQNRKNAGRPKVAAVETEAPKQTD